MLAGNGKQTLNQILIQIGCAVFDRPAHPGQIIIVQHDRNGFPRQFIHHAVSQDCRTEVIFLMRFRKGLCQEFRKILRAQKDMVTIIGMLNKRPWVLQE